MYILNKDKNELIPVDESTFKALGLRERKDLQEWIAKTPSVLGEELLIIQKEFDGFDDTNERLDLLALDKRGNVVVIENKLDDSGKDTVWQVLKYASYCSQLTIPQIKDIFGQYLRKTGKTTSPEDLLSEFFEGEDYEEKLTSGLSSQRIIMVSGDFRKEVTSTVLWLLTYDLKIQCFKTSITQLKDNIIFDLEQIIPMKEASDYTIKVAQKKRDAIATEKELQARHTKREIFWTQLITEINKHNDMCSNISPSKDNWIGIAMGMTGVSVNLVITQSNVRVEVYINRGSKEENKRVFNYFFSKKTEIAQAFGGELIWEPMEDNVTSRIRYQLDGVNPFNPEDTPRINKFLIDGAERIQKAFEKPILEFKSKKQR